MGEKISKPERERDKEADRKKREKTVNTSNTGVLDQFLLEIALMLLTKNLFLILIDNLSLSLS